MNTPRNSDMSFLKDYAELLVEKAIAAKAALARLKKDGKVADFESGQVMAFYCALSLLEEQAAAFGLTRGEVGLSKFETECLLRE